jgi:hypothetical protein
VQLWPADRVDRPRQPSPCMTSLLQVLRHLHFVIVQVDLRATNKNVSDER